MIRSTLIALSFASLATAVAAEELPLPYAFQLTKGVICDSQFQVEQLLTEISLNDRMPDEPVEGCGMIGGSLHALVEPLGWYETPVGRTLIASFTAPNGWVQYGWIDFELNPDYVPAAHHIDA